MRDGELRIEFEMFLLRRFEKWAGGDGSLGGSIDSV